MTKSVFVIPPQRWDVTKTAAHGHTRCAQHTCWDELTSWAVAALCLAITDVLLFKYQSHKHNLKESPGEKSFFPTSTRSRIIHLLLLLPKKTIIETMEITYRFQRHRHVLNLRGGGTVARSCLTFATLLTVDHQAPLSVGFPRQAYWRGLPVPSPT